MKSKTPDPCPCGRNAGYAACCARYHDGVPAPDAETLMRSRYSAYCKGLESYLIDTWHADTRPAIGELNLAATPPAKWIGLEVKDHKESADDATVEFVARYRVGGRAYRLHEISRFTRQDERWYYRDGTLLDET
ncbi:MAG TPA: YchJ family metal-binding protein [Rhodocyclaceae bacterium]|nr:YchJ family metal-binding protein [Rhodocyclaceae bacterium]